MASWQAKFISALLRNTFKKKLARAQTIEEIRKVMSAGPSFRVPQDVRISPASLGQTPGEWVEPVHSPSGPIVLFLHGGGYFACSVRTHRPYTTAFAQRGFRVYACEYRLAPEHKCPAGVEDAVAAYLDLRKSAPGTPIVLAGDSAGGGLCVATMIRLRELGEPLPAAAALFSPFVNVADATGGSRDHNADKCAMFAKGVFAKAADFYLAPGADPRDRLASPLFADLRGLPPLLIHVGAEETLLDDSTMLAERARAAGVPVEIVIWPAVSHDWHFLHGFIPEGKQSLDAAAAFLRRETLNASVMETVIVGAGFAGLGMAIQLLKAGRSSFVVLEAADDIGGTWRANTYPGCACDIPSHLYSFSFDPNPNWSRRFPAQPEIWKYLRDVVDRHRLRHWIRCHAEVSEAAFDEVSGVWTVTLKSGESIRAKYVVFATGPLSKPAFPDIAGIQKFRGAMFHSAEWDHGYDLTGKRVAAIGTGASAIQYVPEIAPKVKELHVFQRTPPWVVPRLDRPISGFAKWLYRNVPGALRLRRYLIYLRNESFAPGLNGNQLFNEYPRKMALRNLESQVADPKLRALLTPNYHIGCKRILISDDYYPALQRSNVQLVTDSIREIDEAGVVTQDGTHRGVDAIVLGTGFRVTDFLAPVKIFGRGGLELTSLWKREGARAYYGISVSGFPNMFILVGPNTGLGHNSIVFMIEAQVRYILDCMAKLEACGARTIEVKAEVQASFNERIHAKLAKAVWSAGGCQSWYLDEHGRNPTIWPGSTVPYWRQTRHARLSDYQLR